VQVNPAFSNKFVHNASCEAYNCMQEALLKCMCSSVCRQCTQGQRLELEASASAVVAVCTENVSECANERMFEPLGRWCDSCRSTILNRMRHCSSKDIRVFPVYNQDTGTRTHSMASLWCRMQSRRLFADARTAKGTTSQSKDRHCSKLMRLR
jgi:hypothetical protein